MNMDRDTSSILWTSASCSHPGRVRQNNEDACVEQAEHGLWAVADGMGGHSMGEFASGLAIQSLMHLPAAAIRCHLGISVNKQCMEWQCRTVSNSQGMYRGVQTWNFIFRVAFATDTALTICSSTTPGT